MVNNLGSTAGDIVLIFVMGAYWLTSHQRAIDFITKLSSLRSETVSGELTYDGSLDPAGRYEFHSQSGDIRLRIPASAGLHPRGAMKICPGLRRGRQQAR